MLQWKMDNSVFEVKENDSAVAAVSEDSLAPSVLFNHVVETLAMTLTRFGITSAAATVAVALLIATMLLGITATDAVALSQWCPRC